MKKKIISLCTAALSFALMLVLLPGCANTADDKNTQQESSQQESTQEQETAKSKARTEDSDANATDTKENVTEHTIGDIQLVKTDVLDGAAAVFLPSTFEIMSDDMLEVKYPNGNPPTLVYTNERGTVNVAFNHTDTEVTASLFSLFLDQIKSTFEQTYPTAEFYRSEIVAINGKDFGVVEVVTPGWDTDIYNLMWFTDIDGTLMITSFNCPVEDQAEWQEAANYILEHFGTK